MTLKVTLNGVTYDADGQLTLTEKTTSGSGSTTSGTSGSGTSTPPPAPTPSPITLDHLTPAINTVNNVTSVNALSSPANVPATPTDVSFDYAPDSTIGASIVKATGDWHGSYVGFVLGFASHSTSGAGVGFDYASMNISYKDASGNVQTTSELTCTNVRAIGSTPANWYDKTNSDGTQGSHIGGLTDGQVAPNLALSHFGIPDLVGSTITKITLTLHNLYYTEQSTSGSGSTTSGSSTSTSGSGTSSGSSSGSTTASFTPIEKVALESSNLTNAANLTATIGSNTYTATAPPGTRVRCKDQNGKLGPLTLRHFGEGGVSVENILADSPGDLSGTYKIVLGSSNTLFNGSLTIWTYSRTRPFWYNQPKLLSSWDKSKVANYGSGSGSASVYKLYGNADNSPMGIGVADPHIGDTGERMDLGLLPEWDAAYVVNPTSNNAEVVRGMSDAASPWGFHVIDPNTLVILKATDWPKATNLSVVSTSANPLSLPGSSNPAHLSVGSASAHAPAFGILASLIYGTSYDFEVLEFWANYIGCLWANPNYRLNGGAGPVGARHIQARGYAWSQRQLAAAAALSKNFSTYFQNFASQRAKDINAKIDGGANGGLPIFGDYSYSINGGKRNGISPWQNDFIVQALGYTVLCCGLTDFQKALNFYGQFQVQRLNYKIHELATLYEVQVKDSNGNITATDWSSLIDFNAKNNTAIANAIAAGTNTQALLDALNETTGYQVGDFHGYPWSATGYPAILQPAIAMCVDGGVTGATAAWSVFQKYARMDYSGDPKYNIVPKGSQ